MGTDGKYGRVTTERKQIPEGEPVIVLRAQDALAAAAIDYYRSLCVANGTPQSHVDAVDGVLAAFTRWQALHDTKLPD